MKNWMKNIPDDKRITGINMPGTHDSACCFVDFGFISKTQKLTVMQQLEAGVRYFDFRFRFDGKKFIANHSISYCRKKNGFRNEMLTADDIVNDCIGFLKSNPTETILFQLKESQSQTGNSFYASFYKKYISENADMFFVENRVPTMGEARGKMILLRVVSVDKSVFTDDNCGIDFTAYPYVGTYNVDDWRSGDIKKLDGTVYARMFVQDSYKSEGKHKWGTVTGFLESCLSENNFNICYTSCTRLMVPRFNVRYINPRLVAYFTEKKYYGIITADFIDDEICKKIVRTNFR